MTTREALYDSLSKRRVLESVHQAIPHEIGDRNNLWIDVETALGEVLGNSVKQKEVVEVEADVEEDYFLVILDSESIRKNNDTLSLLLGHVQACIDHGTDCFFFFDEHGLGLYLLARLTEESCFINGKLYLRFSRTKEPQKRVLNMPIYS